MQTLPICRLTSAACELTPPTAVRMPSAAFMPRMSSGVVSLRTRMILADGFACLMRLGLARREDDHARGGAGTGGDALGEQLAAPAGGLLGLGIEERLQELVQVAGRDEARRDGLFLRDQAFLDQVDRDANGGEPGPLGVSRLQHVQLVALRS